MIYMSQREQWFRPFGDIAVEWCEGKSDKGPSWFLVQVGGRAGERADGDEAVRLPGAAHASRAARSLALPTLALPARLALARARQGAVEMVLDGTRAFDGGIAGA